MWKRIIRYIIREKIYLLIIGILSYPLILRPLFQFFIYAQAQMNTSFWETPIKKVDYFIEHDKNSIFLVLKLPEQDINEIINHAYRLVPRVKKYNIYNYLLIYKNGDIVICSDKDTNHPYPLLIPRELGGKIEGITKFYEGKPLDIKK